MSCTPGGDSHTVADAPTRCAACVSARACGASPSCVVQVSSLFFFRVFVLVVVPAGCIADGRVVSNFIIQALSGEDITIYGDGSQTRSFCFVDDLIEGLMRLMNNDTEVGHERRSNQADEQRMNVVAPFHLKY